MLAYDLDDLPRPPQTLGIRVDLPLQRHNQFRWILFIHAIF